MFSRSSSPSRMSGRTSGQSTSTTARSSPSPQRTSSRRLMGSAPAGVTSRTTRQVHWHPEAAWVSMPSSSSSPVAGSPFVRITAAASPMRKR